MCGADGGWGGRYITSTSIVFLIPVYEFLLRNIYIHTYIFDMRTLERVTHI